MLFTTKLKQLRKENNLLQRQLSAFLEIDSGLYSKIERGERKAKREQVLKLAELFDTDKEELLTLWLADQIKDIVYEEKQIVNDVLYVVKENMTDYKQSTVTNNHSKTNGSEKRENMDNKSPKIVSLFAGAGGLDLGFKRAGFDIIWANEFDREIWETYEKNHRETILDRRSIIDIPSHEVPDCDGIIGGPPCQSWSEAGALRGIKDKRGQLFYEFIRILADKRPKFFLAENVSGMLLPVHRKALENIKDTFTEIGYNLSFQLLNVSNYGVPQDRKRVFFVGYRKDLGIQFEFPEPTTSNKKINLKKAIGDLKNNVIPARQGNYTNGNECVMPNHEYMIGGFSTIFMSRNRVRSWDETSFTIQAGGRHAPLHPQAPKMKFIEQNKRIFVPGKEHLYRRLSVRECARIQTFPDNFIFYYNNLSAAYKMIGNAVPVRMAKILAGKILSDLLLMEKNEAHAIALPEANGGTVKEQMNKVIQSYM